MEAPSSADTRLWSRINFAEYGYGEDPFDGDVPKESTLAADFDPTSDNEVELEGATGLPTDGALLITADSHWWLIVYTGLSGDTLSGVSVSNSDGLNTALTGSRTQEYRSDLLDTLLRRSQWEFTQKTGLELVDVEDAVIPGVQECLQLLTEWRAVAGQQEVVETGADFDLIGSFSAGTYSETRRMDNRMRLVLHPVPRIAELLLLFMTPEKRAALGFEAPAVSELEDPADWESARNILRPARAWDPAFGPVAPPWF